MEWNVPAKIISIKRCYFLKWPLRLCLQGGEGRSEELALTLLASNLSPDWW